MRATGHTGLAAEILRAAYRGVGANQGKARDTEDLYLEFPRQEPALFAACCYLCGLDETFVAQRFAAARKQAESR